MRRAIHVVPIALVLATAAACANIISTGDLNKVDCIGACDPGADAAGGGVADAGPGRDAATRDASLTGGAGGASGGGGSVSAGGAAGTLAGGGGAGGSTTGAGGSAGATSAGGASGAAGRGGAGGSGGSSGVPQCPATGWPKGFVCIPAGTFQMGSPNGEVGRYTDEVLHSVTISRPYWMGATEVTQGEYQGAMGNNPSSHRTCGPSCPVESLTWFDMMVYANTISNRDGYAPCYFKSGGMPYDGPAAGMSQLPVWRDGFTCPGYRLPTEAEWEYAARAGTTTGYFTGDPSTTMCMPLDGALGLAGWYCGNANNMLHQVGAKRANAWGLFDMHGSVYERTWDFKSPYAGPATDPKGPASGTEHMTRGGSFVSGPDLCRSAVRTSDPPIDRYDDTGFRVVRSLQ